MEGLVNGTFVRFVVVVVVVVVPVKVVFEFDFSHKNLKKQPKRSHHGAPVMAAVGHRSGY